MVKLIQEVQYRSQRGLKITSIGWIADNFYPQIQRGAELEDNILINEAQKRGYKVIKINKLSGKIDRKINYYVVANCIDTFNGGELLGYLSRKPYIHIEHDLRAPQCPWYPMLAENALINIYHSPLQETIIKEVSGNYKSWLHPMCLSKKFKDLHHKRYLENKVLYVGDYSMEKGYREMREWIESRNSDCFIYHYGGGFAKKHDRMWDIGNVPQENMPQIYNRFSSMIFLPRMPQACSRVMGEAYLCKIPNIITNNNNGFTSYGWTEKDYESVRERLTNGQKFFWDEMETYIK